MTLRFLIVITVILGTGCSGLFAEFPEFDGGDVGPSVEDDAGEPVEYNLVLEEGPPSEVTAGESFAVVFQLVDGLGNELEMEGVELDVSVSDGEFSGGENQVSALSDTAGRVEFGLSIEVARSGLILTATSEHEDFSHVSVATDPFDVVAAQALVESSSIEGVGNAVADGDDEAQIEIALFDEFQNPLLGVIPEFEARGEEDEIEGGECSAINEEGVAKCTMTSMVAETKALSITHPISLENGGQVEFFPFCDPNFPDPFGGGAGESDDPYLICTATHLNDINNAKERSFLLTQDLNMETSSFYIIASQTDTFTGHFDGGGFAINNLEIDGTDNDFIGLFANIEDGATVENLVLENLVVRGKDFVGGVAGQNSGEIRNVSIIDATVEASGDEIGGLVGRNLSDITDSSASGDISGDAQVGGLVGRNLEGSIVNSEAGGSVVGSGQNIGGLVGLNEAGISGSTADVEVRGDGGRVGGLAGATFGFIRLSTASGSVEGGSGVGGLVGRGEGPIDDSHAHGRVRGTSQVGGLVGFSSAEINKSSATGDVIGDISNSGQLGGLVGSNQSGDINECYATGNVEGDTSIGGLVGVNHSAIRQSYSIGDVTGRVVTSGGNGGFVGRNLGTIHDSYTAAREVSDDSSTDGGFYGTNHDDAEIIDSFWDSRSFPRLQDGVTRLATSDFDDFDTFSGWDFGEVWEIGTTPEPDEEQRPVFQWQE